jgi:molecular chaperone HtpG
MTLIVNSFYKKKKISSELISNCQDPCDKIRYESLKNAEVFGEQKELKIDILPDKENKRINLTDTELE